MSALDGSFVRRGIEYSRTLLLAVLLPHSSVNLAALLGYGHLLLALLVARAGFVWLLHGTLMWHLLLPHHLSRQRPPHRLALNHGRARTRLPLGGHPALMAGSVGVLKPALLLKEAAIAAFIKVGGHHSYQRCTQLTTGSLAPDDALVPAPQATGHKSSCKAIVPWLGPSMNHSAVVPLHLIFH